MDSCNGEDEVEAETIEVSEVGLIWAVKKYNEQVCKKPIIIHYRLKNKWRVKKDNSDWQILWTDVA